MKKVILILTLIIISVCGFGQSLNVEPYGKSIIDYKRIGNTIYLEYRKFIDNAGHLGYPENYSGTIYYVASDGSDSNDGSKTSPFATITKVNTLTLSANDAVLFESSGSYQGTITVGQSGTLGNPITIGAYGSIGSKPKIYGSELITGWTKRGGSNIYVAHFTTDITQLFVNGVRQELARLKDGYDSITAVSSQTVFTATIPTDIDYTGAKVMLRPELYFSEVETVISSSGATVTIGAAVSSGTIAVNEGVVFMNKLEFLDSPGEWYYDSTTDSLYYWAVGNVDPDTFESVRGSTLDNGIYASAKNNIVIKDLQILQQKVAGISISSNSTNITIQNNVIDGQESYGIYSLSGDGWTIDNNTISNQNGFGIYASTFTGSTISNNTITNIGLLENMGLSGTTANNGGSGMEVSGLLDDGNILEYNTVLNTGYNGIFWRGTSTLQYNYIKNTCLVKGDGAAIYSGSPTTAGSLLQYNIIENSVGPIAGYTFNRPYGLGIYLDEGALSGTVQYNTVIGTTDAAIFLHKPNNHTIRYNKTFDARMGIYYANTSTGTSNVVNNMFITGSATDDYLLRQLLVWETTTGVALDNNTYVNGFASDNVFNKAGYLDFAGWKTATGGDAASTYIGTDLGVEETQLLVYNNTATTKTFYLNAATGVKDENGTTITTSFTVAPFESKYIRGINIDCILDYSDAVAPTITAFAIPDSVDNFIIPITTFTATGNATAYKITESATVPNLTDAGWSSTIPTTYTTSSEGIKTLYAWVRDAAGNISTSATDNIVVTVYFDLLANIVSWHEANSASGTTLPDSKSGGSSGTLYAGATIDQTGNLGEAILFDGTDDYAYIPRNTSIFTAGMPLDYSVLFRFQLPTIAAASKRIFEVSYGTDDFFNITNTVADNLIATMAKNNSRKSFNTTSAITAANWYVAVVTWNATTETFKFYLNGTLITNSTATFGVNGGHASMTIGRKLLEPTYTNMLFETLGVFDKVLSQDEINWLQNKEFSDL